jgi:hypothetical protein
VIVLAASSMSTRAEAASIGRVLAWSIRAAPEELGESIEDAQAAYAAGIEARERGDQTAAAREFFSAYQRLPPEPRERRAAVLFDLIAARRGAYEDEGDAAQLCASQRILSDYLASVASEDSEGEELARDAKKARELDALVHSDLAQLRAREPEFDCVVLRVEGEAPPDEDERRDEGSEVSANSPRVPTKTLLIGGYVSVGIGAAALAMMISGIVVGGRARADADALISANPARPAGDPLLGDLAARHRLGDALAISGGLLAGAALGAGITMILVGTYGRERRLSMSPYLAGRAAGASMSLRF